jgi:hypothetical protein
MSREVSARAHPGSGTTPGHRGRTRQLRSVHQNVHLLRERRGDRAADVRVVRVAGHTGVEQGLDADDASVDGLGSRHRTRAWEPRLGQHLLRGHRGPTRVPGHRWPVHFEDQPPAVGGRHPVDGVDSPGSEQDLGQPRPDQCIRTRSIQASTSATSRSPSSALSVAVTCRSSLMQSI